MSGLYIHIPFCKQACSYCNFYFVTRQEYKQDFVDALVREIHHKKDTRFAEQPVETIYIGGGTPSLLTIRQVHEILEAVYEVFKVEPKEITFETNPDDVTEEFLEGLKSAGVNRASMGVQSFQPELLKFMNRAHNADEALRCMQLLKASGIDVFTVDLIYGNPGQTLAMLEEDLDRLLSFNPPHVSAYSLTIEPRTRLAKQIELGRIIAPKNEIVSDHYDLVVQRLKAAGIEQYEVSNFAKPGSEAIHNSSYWTHVNYLGLGPGAHSFWWNEDEKSAQRWNNKSDLKAYLNDGWKNRNEVEELSLEELAEERLMLSMRTQAGIHSKEMKSRYNFTFNKRQQQYLEKLAEKGKAELLPEQIRLTTKGRKIADAILLDLVTM